MNLHTLIIDQHLGLEPDAKADDMRLALASALTALRMARPSNQRSAQQIAVARRQIMQALRRAA